jgi:hypothetical protein
MATKKHNDGSVSRGAEAMMSKTTENARLNAVVEVLRATLCAELDRWGDLGETAYMAQRDWTARKSVLKPLIRSIVDEMAQAEWSPAVRRHFGIPSCYVPMLMPRQRKRLAIQAAYDQCTDVLWESLPWEQEYIHEAVPDYLPVDYPGTDWRGVVAACPLEVRHDYRVPELWG